MAATPEQYCGVVSGVVCGFCPLNLVQEAEWVATVQPSTTPFYLALELGKVLEFASEASQTGSDDPGLGLEWHSYDGQTDEEFEVLLADLARHAASPVEPAPKPMSPSENELELALRNLGETAIRTIDGEQGDHPVVRGLKGCIDKIMAGECEVDRSYQPSPFTGIASRELAADMLSVVARFGPDEDVLAMFEKVWTWGWDNDFAPETRRDTTIPEVRTFLMHVAEILRTDPNDRQEE